MKPMVLEHLSKRFGGLQALQDVGFTVEQGQRRAILGPNGAGKTTLFNVICGEERADTGNIYLFGTDAASLPTYRRTALGMARTYQITSLFPRLTVLQNVVLAAQGLDQVRFKFHRPVFNYEHIMHHAEELLVQWNLWDKNNIPVPDLSYGDQRLVEIVMALASKPKLLLLDEPTAGLSPAETQSVVLAMKDLDTTITVLLIEHDMDVVFEVADSITVLHQGCVLADGPRDDVRQNTEVLRVYLGND